jgi:hypothetical protein
MTTDGSGTSATFGMASFSSYSDMFDMSELSSSSMTFEMPDSPGRAVVAGQPVASVVYSTSMVLNSQDAKQLLGAEVMQTTLEAMNSNSCGSPGANSDCDAQTEVLECGPMAKGTMVSGKV